MSAGAAVVRSRTSPAKRTDLGNAQRLAARNAEIVRYVRATDTWHIWNGERWAPDEVGQIDRLARQTVRAMQLAIETMPVETDEQIKAQVDAAKWAVASEAASRLSAMIQLARYEAGIAVTATAFDNEPWELNTPNGIVDLRTGKLGNHDPARMHSQITAVPYRKGAKAPRWAAFVKRVLPDPKVRAYVQRLLGASLVGLPLPGATFPFCFGPGGTGKSTLLEPVLAAIGDYGVLAPANLLVAKRGGGDQTYDIAALRGKRFVLASEGSSRQRLAEDVVKRVTADSTLAGRQIREAEITFPNVTSLWFMSNHEPRIDSTDTGLQRRIREIPMDVVLDPVTDLGLKEAMVADELPGILAWCVAGCVAWQKDGELVVPEAVTEATQAYFDDSNPLLEWVEADCVLDPDAMTPGPDLHASYSDWCAGARRPNDYPSGRSKTWARALKSLGLEPVRHGQVRGYAGISIRQPAL